MADDGKMIIPMSGRRPVRITEADWPIVADAGDSAVGYVMRVRQHADGRVLVEAAIADATRAGELLRAGSDIAAAIKRAGAEAGIPAQTIRACLDSMSAEDI